MKSDQFTKPTPFKVGRIEAQCQRCSGTQFLRARRFVRERADSLVCFHCGAEQLRSDLMRQITAKVLENADRALKRADELRAGYVDQVQDAKSAVDELLAKLKEAEELLLFPAVKGHVQSAGKLLLAIARRAPSLRARHAAMNAIALVDAQGGRALGPEQGRLAELIRQVREALHDEKKAA